jgi:hypothetical protein
MGNISKSADGNNRLAGFILPRGKLGFEAFDRHERSVGMFPTQQAAAASLDAAAAAPWRRRRRA